MPNGASRSIRRNGQAPARAGGVDRAVGHNDRIALSDAPAL